MIEPETESLLALDTPAGSVRVDRFQEWLHAPTPLESMHPRFDIRRAVPSLFDRIYDLVDDTFGFKRSRPQYDWMYRRNPYGTARCWLTFDRASGQLIGSWASWPWPMAKGTQSVEGCQDGDWVVAKGWQRYGTGDLCADALKSHPWQARTIRLAWPNEKSRGVAVKHGHAGEILGPVPKATLVLNAESYLAELKWPALVRAVAGRTANAMMTAWSSLVLPSRGGFAFQAIQRFDSSFDDVTWRSMNWPGFWSPHDADFLNWRYLEHPASEHLAFALMSGGKVAGYYVLKIQGQASWLMEFVAPVSPRRFAAAMLLHMIDTARAAGCSRIHFSAPPQWRHWKLMRTAGFLSVPSEIYLWPWPKDDAPEVGQLTMWQCVPGDMDYL